MNKKHNQRKQITIFVFLGLCLVSLAAHIIFDCMGVFTQSELPGGIRTQNVTRSRIRIHPHEDDFLSPAQLVDFQKISGFQDAMEKPTSTLSYAIKPKSPPPKPVSF
jgi:hypothetical protein